MRFVIRLLFLSLFFPSVNAHAAIVVDRTDIGFSELVDKEINAMKSGNRGLVCSQLIERLETASATTTIKRVGPDESTWHPNDRKGTRSYVVAADTRVRGSERTKPTDAVLFLHPSRIDPTLSLYKLGTFVHELSFAADLNDGKFSADFRQREKRASFYRNAWLDSLGLRPIQVSDRIPTPEYTHAKQSGLITEENRDQFPLLDVPAAEPSAAPPQVTPTP